MLREAVVSVAGGMAGLRFLGADIIREFDGHDKLAIIIAMPTTLSFRIVYAESVNEHLSAIQNKYLSLIRNTIETQLRFEPHIETRNRKPLEKPIIVGATWELRFGPNNRFRVLYDVQLKEKQVAVLAIGVKIRNELWLGKERVGNYENRTVGSS